MFGALRRLRDVRIYPEQIRDGRPTMRFLLLVALFVAPAAATHCSGARGSVSQFTFCCSIGCDSVYAPAGTTCSAGSVTQAQINALSRAASCSGDCSYKPANAGQCFAAGLCPASGCTAVGVAGTAAPAAPGPAAPAGGQLDPHLTFAHGGRADFKGKNHTWYNMLSAQAATMNALFEHENFHNKMKLIHGSYMKSMAWVFQTASGLLITIEYNTTQGKQPLFAYVRERGSDGRDRRPLIVTHGKSYKQEGVSVAFKTSKEKDFSGMPLVVSNGKWESKVLSRVFPNPEGNPGKTLLNVQLNPRYDVEHDPVAPHGLIGQSYDGDDVAIDGAVDDYNSTEVTTMAMAEGAIEGKPSDYEMADKFDVDFKFSRFWSTAAKPRDVSKLTGKKKAGSRRNTTGAVPDVESF